MKDVKVFVDAETYGMARDYAAKEGISVSELFTRAIRSVVCSKPGMTAEEFFALADDLPRDRKPLN